MEERARRRYLELVQRGEVVKFEDVLAGLKQRDQIDTSREVAPLKAAEDAVVLNTDGMNIEEVMKKVFELFEDCGNE